MAKSPKKPTSDDADPVPAKAADFVVTDETTDGSDSPSPAPLPTEEEIAARQASIDEALNAAIHGILAYARNLPPAKPIEVGDVDAMRATARTHLHNFLS
ncbi:MAG TPA: hypothetical protein PKA20_17430 [Burkholderiaceae bacterium]|nr:hypothetical protein [Burkholderiaceae bacterium]